MGFVTDARQTDGFLVSRQTYGFLVSWTLLGSRFSVLGIRYSVFGTRYSVLRIRKSVKVHTVVESRRRESSRVLHSENSTHATIFYLFICWACAILLRVYYFHYVGLDDSTTTLRLLRVRRYVPLPISEYGVPNTEYRIPSMEYRVLLHNVACDLAVTNHAHYQ